MRINKNIYYILIPLVFINWSKCSPYKRIYFYKQEVSVEVPNEWDLIEPYRKFSNYNIKYNAKASNDKSESILTLDVFDSSHMYNTAISKGFTDRKESEVNTKGASTNFVDSGIVKVTNHEVGYLKYTFKNKRNVLCYGANLFFRTSFNDFYEIELYSLIIPSEKFKPIADKIIESLQINNKVP